jgi:LysR family hydrogen peroxide-inducible transcriptional activator
MPTLRQLRCLVALADTPHFRRAAEQCHVSQPTLSGQLRALESRLGVQLVERSRTRVVLTVIGQDTAVRARRILQETDDLIALARAGHGPLGGTLRLGVLHSLGPYLLPHILPELHESYPELKLHVRERLPGTLLRDLEEGHLDLLIYPLPLESARLRVVRLFREPLMIAAPRDHPLAGKAAVERTDLKGETILALEEGHRLHDQVEALCRDYGARLAREFEGTSLDTLRQMVGMGMGLTFLPSLYVRSEIPDDREVIVRPLRSRPPSRSMGLAWRRTSARDDEYAILAGQIRGILKGRVAEVTVMS